MAIFRPSSIVQAISGTLGGQNYTKTGGRNVVRTNRRARRNPADDVLLARQRLKTLQLAWDALTADEQLIWRTRSTQFAIPDRNGDPRYLTPRNFFARANTYFWADSGTISTAPGLLAQTQTPSKFGLQIISGGNKIAAYSTLGDTSNLYVVIQAYRPFATRRLAARNRYKNIQVAAWPTFGNLVFTTAFDAILGDPAVDEYIAARGRLWNPGELPSNWVYKDDFAA